MSSFHLAAVRSSLRVLGRAALLFALPFAARAQLAWSAFDETNTTSVANQPDGTTVVTVPAGQRVTLVSTNFVPVDFTANPTGEVYATINFKVSGGLGTISSGTRAVGFGLYNNNGTATNYGDDNGYFTWLNGNTGSLIELRRRNGNGASPSLLNPASTAYVGLGTGEKVNTPGTLADGNSYSIQLHLMGRNPGVSFGNTSSSTTGAGVWVNGDNFSVTAYTNPDNPPAAQVFNEVGFMFYNSGTSAVTLTINSVTGLTAINPPSITAQPAAISVNPGQAGTLTVVAAGTSPLAYQWKKDGTAIAGATSASYTIASAATADAGNYTVTITNTYGNVTSSAAAVTVTTQPIPATITSQPASVTVNAGQNATFSVAAYGSSPVTYQWNKNGTPLAGTTSSSLGLSNVATTDAATYTVTVANAAGTVTSSAATLTVNTKPAFTSQPVSVSTSAGQSVTFTAAASGSPAPTIQWQRNGVNIAGATGTTLTLNNVTLANTGVYTARAVNSVGATTSAGALLSIPSSMAATALWPASGAAAVNTDTPLRITFDRAPVVGNFGKVQIWRASDNTVVDTLDLGSTPYTRTIGTQSVQYIFHPILVTNNTATIYPHAGVLAYGQTYYVTIDPGVLLDSTGATFAGISDANTWRFSTKASGPAANATALTVAADGSGDFTTVQGAIDFVPANNTQRVVITVEPGTYTEMVYVGKPFITVQGADRANTVIQYADNNNFNTLTGNNRAMFSVDAPDFTLQTITLHNLTPKGGSQAEAFRANALRVTLNRVNLLSYQDTFLVNGNNCSAFVTDSYIEGDVDFMWGSGAVYFQRCELKMLSSGGYYAQVRNGLTQNGFIYVDCKLTSAPGVTGAYLARIDPTPGNFPYSQVYYINCAMGPHIAPAGWLLNNATSSSTVQFGEYHSTDLNGATLDVSQRISSSRQLTDSEAALWSNPAYVLGGWVPQIAPTIETSPVSASVTAGSNARLTVVANGSPEPVLQWYKDGVAIPGATGATLVIPNVQPSAAGNYTVTASNVNGSVTSAAASLTVGSGSRAGEYFGTLGDTGKFALYVRNNGTGVFLASTPAAGGSVVVRNVMVDTGGNFSGSSGTSSVTGAISSSGAVSGSLMQAGATTPTTTVTLTFAGTESAGSGASQSVAGEYELGSSGSSTTANVVVDASGNALVVTQSAGKFDAGSGTVSNGQLTVTTAGGQTMTLTLGAGAATGTVVAGGTTSSLGGVSDVIAPTERFGELSTRASAGTGDNVAIVGFTIAGDTPDNILIRAVGPTLTLFGVSSPLATPRIDLYHGGTLVASNAGWTTPNGNGNDIALAAAQSGAFPLRSTSADAALHLMLMPGSYTAIMSNASGSTSAVGLLEVYEVSGGAAGQRLTNLSARAVAGSGNNTLISGFLVTGSQPKRMLVRAVGPGLSAYGIASPLAKPVLSIYRGSTLVAQNTGWSTSTDASAISLATAEIGAFALGTNSADSALLINLAPGLYTAQVTSADGTTGTALLELYEAP
ncbi:MAG TPA: pectinesterase family protein [Opitutaceae bacterium]|nr:pectinesterase family protein [Opitutaceae bacterium]